MRAELGNQFAILGVSAEPAQLMPGETADVTVVWQALAPMRDDYSVFVHLVNEEGITIAQTDTMPGGGLRPTSQWSAGETRAERYAVTIPAAAYTPDRGRWAVGLYDHKTGERLPVRLIERRPDPGRQRPMPTACASARRRWQPGRARCPTASWLTLRTT